MSRKKGTEQSTRGPQGSGKTKKRAAGAGSNTTSKVAEENGQLIYLNLDPAYVPRLDKLAEKVDRSRSSLLRHWCQDRLEGGPLWQTVNKKAWELNGNASEDEDVTVFFRIDIDLVQPLKQAAADDDRPRNRFLKRMIMRYVDTLEKHSAPRFRRMMASE